MGTLITSSVCLCLCVCLEGSRGNGGLWVGSHGEDACWSAQWNSRQVNSHSDGWYKRKAIDVQHSAPMVSKGPRFLSVNLDTLKVLWELQKTLRSSLLWSLSCLFGWQPKLESCHWTEAAEERVSFEIREWELEGHNPTLHCSHHSQDWQPQWKFVSVEKFHVLQLGSALRVSAY